MKQPYVEKLDGWFYLRCPHCDKQITFKPCGVLTKLGDALIKVGLRWTGSSYTPQPYQDRSGNRAAR